MTDRLDVGRVARSHGLRGDVLVKFTTDRTAERTEPGAELIIGGVTHTVTRGKPHQQQFLMHFVGVDDREAADRLRGKTIEAEPIDDADALFVHEQIGRTVVDQHGVEHGPVVSVVANPASDLLELDDGRLIPMVFVTEAEGDVIRVDVPAGLLDD